MHVCVLHAEPCWVLIQVTDAVAMATAPSADMVISETDNDTSVSMSLHNGQPDATMVSSVLMVSKRND